MKLSGRAAILSVQFVIARVLILAAISGALPAGFIVALNELAQYSRAVDDTTKPPAGNPTPCSREAPSFAYLILLM